MGSFAVPAVIAGLSALAGAFGGSKSTSKSTTTTNPNFTPEQQQMIDLLTQQYTNQVKNAPQWNKAYETSGVRNFLAGSVNANQNAADALSARGISRTTAGAQGVANTGYQEGNQVANFLAQAPIAEQTNLNTNLNNAASFNASLPVGSTSTSNTTGTGSQPINPVSGFLGGGAQGLAAVLGQQNAATNLQKILDQLNKVPTSTSGNNIPFTMPTAAPSNTNFLNGFGQPATPGGGYIPTSSNGYGLWG